MRYYKLLIALILFIACEREISITKFSDDYSSYEPQVKFEAIILPDASTSLVRVDRVIPIVEEEEAKLFNCEDDDGDWNYYYCETNEISYESRSECEAVDACNAECGLHLYQCLSDCDGNDNLLTYSTLVECQNYCDDFADGFCLTDDVGSDGELAVDADGDGSYDNQIGGDIPIDEDGSEGNGQPDCNEPRVDEYDETLPGLHLQSCDITILDPAGKELQFTFSENASSFFLGSGYSEGWKPVEEYYYETVNYGAYIPDLDNSDADFNFQNYTGLYRFEATCPGYGIVTGEDSLYKSAKFISDIDSFTDCLESESNNTENCMASQSIDEISFNDEDCPEFPEVPCVLTYVSLPENTTYHLSQYEIIDSNEDTEYNIVDDFLQYIHGHRAAPLDSDADWYGDLFNFSFEAAIGVPYKNYAYTVFSFSPAYRNYYYYSTLSLDDSERSNLRDENGNPVMGFFGGLSSHTVKFIINITD